MSALVDYLSIALPIFGVTVMTLGGCVCCIWRRIDRRLGQFEEILVDRVQQQQQQQQQRIYYPPPAPTAPPVYYV